MAHDFGSKEVKNDVKDAIGVEIKVADERLNVGHDTCSSAIADQR